ncbi:hypothetical protein AGLY_007189 [Aphis glycines]|uniref:Uncharacterized protein n=1 Tax=Aphis glycines TaxID=307491 RepID=A0A6G0TR58_APHGL|nr:hypothetical protein AGLY_007189 [Aphis glycines]
MDTNDVNNFLGFFALSVYYFDQTLSYLYASSLYNIHNILKLFKDYWNFEFFKFQFGQDYTPFDQNNFSYAMIPHRLLKKKDKIISLFKKFKKQLENINSIQSFLLFRHSIFSASALALAFLSRKIASRPTNLIAVGFPSKSSKRTPLSGRISSLSLSHKISISLEDIERAIARTESRKSDKMFSKKASLNCLDVFFLRASSIVIKFFKDFDILHPEIVK